MDDDERRRAARETVKAWRATPSGKASVARQNKKRAAAIAQWHREHPDRMRAVKKKSADKLRTPELVAYHNHRSRSARLGLPRLGVSTEDWRSIFEQFGGRCAYCYAMATGRDHVVPLTSGGLDTPDNVVPCCGSCNSKKHTKSLLQFVMAGGAQW